MINIKTALQHACARLEATSCSARLDAELLLMHVLQKNRAFLYAHDTDRLEQTTLKAFNDYIAQREQGLPIAYLVGTREFWSLPLHVNEATLIPRPETEVLVERALALLPQDAPLTLLDLGTGSGAIALALASARPHWTLLASDQSQAALAVAMTNANHLNLTNVHFMHSNWFESIPPTCFDAIVSNPPYIAEADPHLNQGDVRFEPASALSSGPEGMDDLNHIIQNSPAYLKMNGLLLLEHGYQQQYAVKAALHASHYTHIQCWPDAQGHPRVSGGYSGYK